MRNIILSMILCFCGTLAYSQIDTSAIRKIIQDKQAEVGVAVLYKDKVYTLSNNRKYPLMSVFKFHVAVTALKKMEKENIALDSMVYIEPGQMHTNTYSPLRDKYPGQRIHISYGDMITYTITHSDNNTCDWLIGFAGGIEVVDAYIKSIGINAQNLTETEAGMHENIMRCYNNWSTPLAVAELLKKVYTEAILADEYFRFLEKAMLDCSTGTDKLKAGLPAGVRFGHKTGSSDRTETGIKIGDGDAGVIYMPDGSKCYLVVIIKDSKETDAGNAKIMENIASAVYESARLS